MPINLQTFPAPPNLPKGRSLSQWYFGVFCRFPSFPSFEGLGEALTAAGTVADFHGIPFFIFIRKIIRTRTKMLHKGKLFLLLKQKVFKNSY
jgi:hypothetical protein